MGNLKSPTSTSQPKGKIIVLSSRESKKEQKKPDEIGKRIDSLHLEKYLFKIQGPFFCEKKLKEILRRLRGTDIRREMFEAIVFKLERKDQNLINILDNMMTGINDAKTGYISWTKLLCYMKEIEEVNQVEDWVTQMRRRLKYEK